MPSFGDLKDQIIAELHGHTVDVPAIGTLVGPVTATSSELAIDFGDQPGAARPNGIVEVGDELMVVSRFNAANGVATIPAWGRGHRGTTAAAHNAGTPVIVRPRFPRKRVGDVINQVVQASCPPLFGVRDMDPFTTGPLIGWGYALPDDLLRVLRVEATEPGTEYMAGRQVIRNWTVRAVAGQKLLELDHGLAYDSIQVTLACTPSPLVSEGDDFAAVTGLPESAADLVVFGAIARLILGGELARQQVTSVEAAQRIERSQSGSGTTISRYFQALYTQRLEAERDRLQQLYPLTLLRRG